MILFLCQLRSILLHSYELHAVGVTSFDSCLQDDFQSFDVCQTYTPILIPHTPFRFTGEFRAKILLMDLSLETRKISCCL